MNLICPNCSYTDFWKTKDGRLKCKKCRYLFKFKENIFNIPNNKLDEIINLFLLEKSLNEIKNKVQISKYKLLKIIEKIRQIMANDLPDVFSKNKILVQKSENNQYFPFIGLIHKNGSFFAKFLPEISEEEFFNFLKEREKITQIENWQKDFGLIYRKKLYRVFPPSFKKEKDEIDKVFDYLKEKVFKKAGIRKNKFYLHLKEYLWRYNHRNLSFQEMKDALMRILIKL
jgi:predicted nucleic-acid-binding Zn-ribbon protein